MYHSDFEVHIRNAMFCLLPYYPDEVLMLAQYYRLGRFDKVGELYGLTANQASYRAHKAYKKLCDLISADLGYTTPELKQEVNSTLRGMIERARSWDLIDEIMGEMPSAPFPENWGDDEG